MTTAIPLKHLARINERVLSDSTDLGREIRYVDIGSVGRGRLVKEPRRMRFSDAPSRARRLVQPGDTIVSTVRTYLRAVWPVSGEVDDLVVSTGFAVLTPTNVDPRYFSWWVLSDSFIDEVVARSVGISWPAIKASELGDLPIRVPTLVEQRAVADYLDIETSRIDALISKKRRMIELLDERLREVERSVTLSANAPRVPLRWTMSIGSGEGLPSSTLSDNPVGGVPVYGGNGLMGYTPMQSRVNEHSIAVGRVGALCGNVHLVDPPAWITDNALWVRAIRGFDREFLATALRAANLNTAADRTAQPLITGETVKNLAIPQPSEDKQIEIAKAIRAARNKKMQLSDKLGRQLDLLRERRRALITSAVTGRLAVPGVAA